MGGGESRPRLTWARCPRPSQAPRDPRACPGTRASPIRLRHVERTDDDQLIATLAAVAPGTELRDGLERILRGGTGALIVIGNDKSVDSICSGGFRIDIEFSATRLRDQAHLGERCDRPPPPKSRSRHGWECVDLLTYTY